MRLIVAASMLPDGARVTKVSGEKILIVKRVIRVFGHIGAESESKLIPATAGVVFLVNDRGDASAYPDSVEVAVHGTPQELRIFLERLTAEPHQ